MNPDSPWLRGLLVVAALIVLQDAVLAGFRIDGVRPDLPLGFAIVAAIVAGPEVGGVLGFVLGGIEDLFVNTPFGLTALVACVIAFATGSVHQAIGADHPWTVPVLAAAGSVVAETSWAALGTVLGLPALLHPHLVVVIVVVSTLNALAAFVFAPVAQWMLAGAGHSASR